MNRLLDRLRNVVHELRRAIVGLPDVTPMVQESYTFWKICAPEFSFLVRVSLLGNEEGEGGFREYPTEADGTTHGPFLWDWKPRAAAIQAATSIDVRVASHAYRLVAALWEIRTRPAVHQALLDCDSIEEIVHVLYGISDCPSTASEARRATLAQKWAGEFLEDEDAQLV